MRADDTEQSIVLDNSGLNELNIHRRSLQKILLSEKPEEKSAALQISWSEK